MSVFFNDLFTEASTTALSAHTSDSGHTWAYFGFNNTHVPNVFTSFGGVVGSGAASATMWRSTGISGTSADAVVTADVRVDAVDTNFTAYGLGARLNSGGTSGYLCYYNRANGFWRLERITGSGLTLTTLADSAAQTYTAGTNITVVLEVSGVGASVSIALKVNGTTLITYSDTAAGRVTAIGYVGFYTQSGGNGLGWFTNSMSADDVVGGGDTTAPILTTAVGAATGTTTATVGATTDEANGSLRVVVTTSATQPSVAQIKAGQDHTGTTVPYAGSQTITTIGAKTISATGLTASTTYYAHNLHTDAANNDSNRLSSASFTTDTPDTTAPTLSSPTATALSNALIAAGVTTNEANGTLYVVATTSATPPTATQIRAGQNNAGTAAVFAANQAISSTGAKTFNVTGLTQLTLYYLYLHHQDAAANNSTVSSASATTFRNGATAQSVIDDTAAIGGNPAGVLYALALTIDPDDWMAYRTISGPTPGTGTLTEYANGSFTFVGPDPAVWVIQPEVNGVDDAGGTITINLYDMSGGGGCPGQETMYSCMKPAMYPAMNKG